MARRTDTTGNPPARTVGREGSVMTTNLEKARQAEAQAGIGSGGTLPTLPASLDLTALPESVTSTMEIGRAHV